MADAKKKRLLFIAAFGFATLCVLFAILEASLRIYHKINPAFTVVPDTTYMRLLGNPHSDEFDGFKLNARGYKDLEFNNKKDPVTFRIIALGDSQTYGAVPYRDSYMTLVEERIRRALPHSEVYNMGIPSAGPVDYLSVLVNEGFNCKPDMVLLHFNIYDDFKNGGKRFKLYSYSMAASFINSVIANIFKPSGITFGAGAYGEGLPWRSDDAYLRMLIDSHGWVFQKNNTTFPDSCNSSMSYVKRIKDLCDARNIILVVVIIPADLQLYPHLQKKAVKQFLAKDDDFDFRIPNRIIAAECKRLMIPWYDLTEHFQNTYRCEHTNFTQVNDPHWNRYGNRIAADAVASWLITQIGSQSKIRRN